MLASDLIRSARERARLSKRALAAAARTSPAAIVHYEAGAQAPTLPTLERILGAAGQRLDTQLVAAPDPVRAGRILAEVLELAGNLPTRPAARRLPYPPFPTAPHTAR